MMQGGRRRRLRGRRKREWTSRSRWRMHGPTGKPRTPSAVKSDHATTGLTRLRCLIASVFVNGLRQLFPGLPILSEESDPKPAALDIPKLHGVDLEEDPWLRLEDLLVTVDPLDATKEFTENLVHYVTTMVSQRQWQAGGQ